MDVRIEQSWKNHLAPQFKKPYFIELALFVKKAYSETVVYPPPKDIFRAFELTPFEKVKVVILGQDPYHGPKQANGLAFAVHHGVATPPSLNNIFKEIERETGRPANRDPDLSRWATQGVLLLNATLTVEGGKAGSHQHKGWEEFTDAAVKVLSDEREGLVFMLWGRYAKEKGAHVDFTKHLVLESAHPSPFSAEKFFGNNHFIKANEYLVAHNQLPIEW